MRSAFVVLQMEFIPSYQCRPIQNGKKTTLETIQEYTKTFRFSFQLLFNRATLCWRAMCCRHVSVRSSLCLSVRPSTSQASILPVAKHRIAQTTPHMCPGISRVLLPKILVNSNRVTPNWNAKYRWGRLKLQYSTNILLYLGNGAT